MLSPRMLILHFTDERTEGLGYVTCAESHIEILPVCGQDTGLDSSSVFFLVSHEALIYKHSSPML